MEQNQEMVVGKKILKMAGVVYFMFRKGISKVKLLSTLNSMMRRGKVAGKVAIQNFIFHHQAAAAAIRREYEFTCGATPAHRSFHPNEPETEADLMDDAEEMTSTEAASPELPGLGRIPIVRVTDSPFPLRDAAENLHVDKAAEEFIMKFYRNLREQNSMPCLSYS